MKKKRKLQIEKDEKKKRLVIDVEDYMGVTVILLVVGILILLFMQKFYEASLMASFLGGIGIHYLLQKKIS